MSSTQNSTVTPLHSGVDPSIMTAGNVSYGLFNKIVPANGIVPGPLGKAVLIQAENRSFVYLTALGLQPSQMYHSHVHADTCANGAGGHFMKDPSLTPSGPDNEIWLSLNTDAQGVAYARTDVPYLTGQRAVSVVIHNLDGTKFYCADLIPQLPTTAALSQWFGGAFQTMATTKPGVVINGNASKVVLNNKLSGFKISIWGLIPNSVYPIHAHAGTCAIAGGGHFQIDANAPSGSSNEIWMNVTASAKGSATNEVWVNQINLTTPSGALSIVIHDPTDGSKQACADLNAISNPLPISGLFHPTATGVDHQLLLSKTNLNAVSSASFQYDLGQAASGPETHVQLNVFGLGPTMYHAHIHTLPCSMGAGGHYKMDPTVTTAVATNEIWSMLNVTANNLASDMVIAPTYFRADAMSAVVHDPTDNSKLLCADFF